MHTIPADQRPVVLMAVVDDRPTADSLWIANAAIADTASVRIERLSFFVVSVRPVPGGWRLNGESGYDRKYWARPGDRFDRACSESGADEQEIDLVVIDLNESSVTVTGFGGNLLKPDDIVSGERMENHLAE